MLYSVNVLLAPDPTPVKRQVVVKIPAGFKVKAQNRIPNPGEAYLYIRDDGTVAKDIGIGGGVECHFQPADRYIIIEKIQRVQHIFTETGEIRAPRAGEWCWVDGEPHRALWNYTSKYPILTYTTKQV